ncbi:MAG: PorV/PorQ family protein [Elusimicrobia bacterium]|nr:PorV/PorQ family protein [Elusimicrobiota bacterium]
MKTMNGHLRLLVSMSGLWLMGGLQVPSAMASGPGTTSLNFLKLGVGARQLAMGGAGVALADDVNAVYWNPAAYGNIERQEASFLYAKWVEGVAYQHAAYAQPQGRWGTWGVQVTALQVTDVKGFDAQDNATGDVTVQDWAVATGWGRRWGKRWRVGGTLKGIRERLDTVNAMTALADAGVVVNPWLPGGRRTGWLEGLSLGVAARNLGPGVKFDSAKAPTPFSVDVGMAYRTFYDAIRVAADWHRPRDGKSSVRTGLEVWLGEYLAVRGGYRTRADLGNGVSVGFGFKAWDLELDYAFLDQGVFGNTHRAGVHFRFGGIPEQLYEQGLGLMRQGQWASAILVFNQVLEKNPRHHRALYRMKQCTEKLKVLEEPGPRGGIR